MEKKDKLGFETSEDRLRKIVGEVVRGQLEVVRGQLLGVEQRLDRIERILVQASLAPLRLRDFLATLVSALEKGRVLRKDVSGLLQNQLSGIEVLRSLESLEKGNPLTPAEVSSLRRYYEMVQQGQPFNEQEVREFYYLSGKAAEEKPADQGLWLLALAAAFLLGVYLGKSDGLNK